MNVPMLSMQVIKKLTLHLSALLFLLSMSAFAESTATMHVVHKSGVGEAYGEIKISQTDYGVLFTPDLSGLPAGMHGFHLHENADCSPKKQDGKAVPAGAAGSHYDPGRSERHDEPWGDGHLGDLPALYVDGKGGADYPVLAPRLKLKDIKGRALIIHESGDNYADRPAPLGGGGKRIACGIIR